jgi:hypothetical protein
MNKEKLVDLGEEVLHGIDEALEKKLRRNLEEELCVRLSNVFNRASWFALQNYSEDSSNEAKHAYALVKTVLDDTLDRLLPPPKTKSK